VADRYTMSINVRNCLDATVFRCWPSCGKEGNLEKTKGAKVRGSTTNDMYY